ncbi:MAG: STAS domain-containing protein [Acidobacteriota bacterium]|nr:STAS domain-containing protein [Acidobacteriota bacterium]
MSEQQPPARELLGRADANELASVTATEHGGGLVVTITGEVDISNIESVAEAINGLPNPRDGLLLDLSEVGYLDSSAISLVHDLAMRLRSRSQQLIVVSPPDTPPRRILDLTALYVNAPVSDTLAGGLSQLGRTGLR